MPKCTYCSTQYPEHEGTTVVDSISGDVKHYCSKKCRIHSERKPKRKRKMKKKKWAVQKLE